MDINAYPAALQELGLTDKGDRHKLVGLFAYNEFFNADAQYADEVNDGIVVSPNYPISGIYLNNELEEDALEIDIAYFPDSASGFRIQDVLEEISQTPSHCRSRSYQSRVNRERRIRGESKNREYRSLHQGIESIDDHLLWPSNNR